MRVKVLVCCCHHSYLFLNFDFCLVLFNYFLLTKMLEQTTIVMNARILFMLDIVTVNV